MTRGASRPAADQATVHRIEIPMPCWSPGGRPVGWLSANKKAQSREAAIIQGKAAAAWYRSAYTAIGEAGVPTGLARIGLQVQYRHTENRDRDPANRELTAKPCIDALQEHSHVVRTNPRTGVLELVIQTGRGIIPSDSPRFVVRGAEMPDGEYLGRLSDIRGMVILHVTPLPAREPD